MEEGGRWAGTVKTKISLNVLWTLYVQVCLQGTRASKTLVSLSALAQLGMTGSRVPGSGCPRGTRTRA